MGRDRTRNKRYPVGWKLVAGIIYFVPTNAGDREIVRAINGKCSIRLGRTHDEAAETYARLIVKARTRRDDVEPGTVAEIVDRAIREYLPSVKVDKTRTERKRHLEELRRLFGQRRYARDVYEASRDRVSTFLRAMDVQKHIHDCSGTRPVAVNREVRTWEIAFQWARAPWGLTEYNPASGLQMNDEKPRRVLPGDADIFKLYRHLDTPARWMVAMIRFYGRRKVELLGLHMSDVQEDGIHFRRGKDADARPILVLWDSRLRKMHARLMRWREEVIRPTRGKRKAPAVVSTALLLNRRGAAYTETGFNSARKRAMVAAGIQGAFTFHDMRKSRAQTLDREKAVTVLAHDDPRTTAAVYRPGPIIVDMRDEADRGIRKKVSELGKKATRRRP
jgi:site-specific recombinase XerD